MLDAGHVGGLLTGGDVELGAQGGVALQPEFVVGFQPVDLAVLEGQESDGAVYFVPVFKAGDLVILMQGFAQLGTQLIIGAVADAENAHAVLLQLVAEHPVGIGEVRRQEDKVFHMYSLLLIWNLRK